MPQSDSKPVVVAEAPDLKAGALHVLRSSGVFAFVDRPWPPPAGSSEPPLQDG